MIENTINDDKESAARNGAGFCLLLSGDAESRLERITERKGLVHREMV